MLWAEDKASAEYVKSGDYQVIPKLSDGVIILVLRCSLTKVFHFPDYYMSERELQGWLMASFALHTLLMMPVYRNLYLKMRALPKI